MFGRSRKDQAKDLTAKGAGLLATDRNEAERCYLSAVDLDPELGVAWFDLGLIYKWSRRWEPAFDCTLRAAELVGEVRDEPAWWNLGIAATALRRWDVARRAWRAYGVSIPDGAGSIDGDFGPGPVRLNPDGGAEVIWGRRIDPARIRLLNIPFPESGHRWGDIVLHDGAPNGHREMGGRQFSVFDELERWAPSSTPTLSASVSAEIPELDRLIAAVEEAGYVAEDWTRNVQILCKRCSEGSVHEEHSRASLATGRPHLVGMAGPPDQIRDVVERWAQGRDCRCHSLDTVA